MNRYIDEDALVKRLKHSPLFLGTNMQFKDGVIDLVKRQPTADVVEVVRCKDCMWWHTNGCAFRNDCTDDLPSAEDFCSQATRKRREK